MENVDEALTLCNTDTTSASGSAPAIDSHRSLFVASQLSDSPLEIARRDVNSTLIMTTFELIRTTHVNDDKVLLFQSISEGKRASLAGL